MVEGIIYWGYSSTAEPNFAHFTSRIKRIESGFKRHNDFRKEYNQDEYLQWGGFLAIYPSVVCQSHALIKKKPRTRDGKNCALLLKDAGIITPTAVS